MVSVAQQLSDQGSILVANHEIHITRASRGACRRESGVDSRDVDASPSETDNDSERRRTIFVEDVPSDLVEFLELCLESEKKGGGAIEKLVHKNGGILVTFEEVQGLMVFRTRSSALIVI